MKDPRTAISIVVFAGLGIFLAVALPEHWPWYQEFAVVGGAGVLVYLVARFIFPKHR